VTPLVSLDNLDLALAACLLLIDATLSLWLRLRLEARLLLAAGPELARTDYTGRTALDHAREQRRSAVQKALRQAGAR